MYETLSKPNKIWFSELNSHISKDDGLNWSKVSKLTNYKIHWNLRNKKHI